MKEICSEPLKIAIKVMVKEKCSNCCDNGFCLLRRYYLLLDNPGSKDFYRLKKCLFYKRIPAEVKNEKTNN